MSSAFSSAFRPSPKISFTVAWSHPLMMPRDAAAMNMFSMARAQSVAASPSSFAEIRISTGALRMGSPMGGGGAPTGAPGGGAGMGSFARASPIRSSISRLRITEKCQGCRFMPEGAYRPAATMVSSASSSMGRPSNIL